MARVTALALSLLLLGAAPAPVGADPARLKATVEKLVSFGTRNSLSSITDPERGIGAARDWAAAQFDAVGKACGGCISAERISRRFSGPRAPDGVIIEDVLGVQRGRDPNRFIIIGAHIDSRGSDPLDTTRNAPGANDDGSGVALVLEAARILSKEHFDATII